MVTRDVCGPRREARVCDHDSDDRAPTASEPIRHSMNAYRPMPDRVEDIAELSHLLGLHCRGVLLTLDHESQRLSWTPAPDKVAGAESGHGGEHVHTRVSAGRR